MVDLILVAASPLSFHSSNMSLNSRHYSGVAKFFGRGCVSFVQGDGVYFNPFVKLDCGTIVKYGVISREALLKDLRDWSKLYVAGRLHKPTLTLSSDDEISDAQRVNLSMALSAALLCMKEPTFDDVRLYSEVAELSYRGDPRMSMGAEDASKISKLVNSPGQLDRFGQLYSEALASLSSLGILSISSSGKSFSWDCDDPSTAARLFSALPAPLRSMARDPRGLRGALEGVVRRAAIEQTSKGLFTAGVYNSVKYAKEKFKKGIAGRSRQK